MGVIISTTAGLLLEKPTTIYGSVIWRPIHCLQVHCSFSLSNSSFIFLTSTSRLRLLVEFYKNIASVPFIFWTISNSKELGVPQWNLNDQDLTVLSCAWGGEQKWLPFVVHYSYYKLKAVYILSVSKVWFC